MSLVLILTHAQDDCAPLIIKHLEKIGADFVRFDTEEFQKTVKMTLNLDTTGGLTGIYHFPEREVHFEDIGVVWNRRVHEPEIEDEGIQDPEIIEWMKDESLWGMNISFTLITAPVINPWEINERLKFNKWIQMQRAAELGIEIPVSRLTNNLDSIREFWEMVGHEMIFKKIRKGLFIMRDGRRLLVHTNRVPPESFGAEAIQRMRFCPMFLQEHVPKKYDVRSVVVGDSVFSVAIHSQNVPEGVVDYRTAAVLGKLDEMKHEPISLGAEIDTKLVAFTKSFGLAFSVIDLVITPDERIVFLEDNPNGQWAWLEHKTGIPISEAIAGHLMVTMKK